MKIKTLLVLLLVAVWGEASAQSGDQPKPKLPNPVIKKLPEKIQWTVSYQQEKPEGEEEAEKPNDQYPVQSVHKKLKKKIYIEKTWANGQKTLEYFVHGAVFMRRPHFDKDSVMTLNPRRDDQAKEMMAGPFGNLDWINKSNYSGVDKKNNQQCYHFEDNGREAWISVQTGLPVASEDEQIKRKYSFKPFNGPLPKPPEAYRKAMQTYLKQKKKFGGYRRPENSHAPAGSGFWVAGRAAITGSNVTLVSVG